jgi:hypothetical protein
MNTPITKFHPKLFESPNYHLPQEDRTISMLRDQRSSKLANVDLDKLESPGSFKLTVDDNFLSPSNTSSLFKNLYGETLLTRLFFSATNVQNIQ